MPLPEWTAFLERFASSNIYGQVELLNARLRQVEQALLIRDMCNSHLKELSDEQKLLKLKAEKVYNIYRILGIEVNQTMNLSGDVYQLNIEVSKALKNPKVAQYLNPSRKPFFAVQCLA